MRRPPERIGYVVKVYPRLSETFIVNEILAHERAGVEVEIFSLRPPVSGRFHELLGRVRGSVTYVASERLKASSLWRDLHEAATEVPHLWDVVGGAADEHERDVHQAALVAREARRRGVEHLHAHFASAAATIARLAATMGELSYSLTAHAKDIFHSDVDPVQLRRKLAYAAVSVTVSDFNAAHLRELCPEAAERIHRVYNGVDLERFPYVPPASAAERIVAVGRLVEKKGFDVLVEACALLARAGIEVDCAIIGEGPEEPRLRELIARHRLADRVRLLGPRTQAEVVDAVAGATALAAPCVIGSDGNRDGLPTVLAEAMALGTPCVSTDVVGIPELVRDGRTGLVVGERDAMALADALRSLLRNPALRARLAGAARELIEAEFDVDRNAAQVRDLIAAARTDVGARPEPRPAARREAARPWQAGDGDRAPVDTPVAAPEVA